MIVNLIGPFTGKTEIAKIKGFSGAVTFFLDKALKGLGVESNPVLYTSIYEKDPPLCDHTIVIVGSAFVEFDTRRAKRRPHIFGTEERRQKAKKFCDRIYNTTSGKTTLFLDSNYRYWDSYFDIVFTIAHPSPMTRGSAYTHPERYVYAGWGADPEYCYPDQDEKAVFVDSLMYGKYNGKFDWIYDIYKSTLPTLGFKIINPWPTYHGRKRLSWPQVQDLFRKSHYFCCTGLGESGLTRIESATCGALLVVPKPLYRPRTMASLEHRIWDTKADLVKILTTETDPEAVRKKALVHSWDKVAARILAKLDAGAV